LDNLGTIEVKNGGALVVDVANWGNAGRMEVGDGVTWTLNGNWSNTGTLRAQGATVNLGGAFGLADLGAFSRLAGVVNLTGVLELGGGNLALTAATGSWTVQGGTLRNGRVTQEGDAKLAFTAFPNRPNTLEHVDVVGDLALHDGQVLVRNGLTVQGTVLLDRGGLTFAGDQIFDGATIAFGNNAGVLGIEDGTTLTLGPAAVVRGKSGSIGPFLLFPGPRKLINQGLIAADVEGGALLIRVDAFDNAGTLAATTAGSTITIAAHPFVNTGALQEANGGRIVVEP
jgi:hypothetical protein